MKRLSRVLVLNLAVLAFAPVAVAQSELSVAEKYPLAMEVIKEAGGTPIEGKVTSINSASRRIEIKFENGKKIETVVKPDVANLQNIDPGDVIKIDYVEATVVKLEKVPPEAVGTAAGGETVQTVGGASDLGLPAESYTHVILAVGKVTQIDAETRNVTIDLGADRLRVVHASDAINLSNVAVDDTVKAMYVENISMSLINKNPSKPQVQ